jgi:glycoprotease/Kae1 family metallohydrolase
MDSTVASALAAAGVTLADVDAVAVTVGPGLSLCLRVGVARAAALAAAAGVPLVPVHHLEAHALVARLDDGRRGEGEGAPPPATPRVPFPYVAVLASGGHNATLLVRGVGDYALLGSTLDDALGEAYDKVARMLGLDPRPSGGAAVEAAARAGDAAAFRFTPPLQGRPGANVSYAGLKTAVRVAAEAAAPGPPTAANWSTRADLAASFQAVAVAHLADRASVGAAWAVEAEPACRHLVLAGGVACNAAVRAAFERAAAALGLALVVPPPSLCTDNGVMVAWAGAERLAAGVADLPRPEGAPSPPPDGWVDCRPRWPLTADVDPRSVPRARVRVKSARMYEDLTSLTAAVRAGRGVGVGAAAPAGARGRTAAG